MKTYFVVFQLRTEPDAPLIRFGTLVEASSEFHARRAAREKIVHATPGVEIARHISTVEKISKVLNGKSVTVYRGD